MAKSRRLLQAEIGDLQYEVQRLQSKHVDLCQYVNEQRVKCEKDIPAMTSYTDKKIENLILYIEELQERVGLLEKFLDIVIDCPEKHYIKKPKH